GPACVPRNFSGARSRRATLPPWGGVLSRVDQLPRECPGDVVDRLLWRNAQAILRRHVIRRDGTCQWCGHRAPCSPRRLAERAEVVSRLPAHPALASRNDPTRLLPLLTADSAVIRGGRPRNSRH